MWTDVPASVLGLAAVNHLGDLVLLIGLPILMAGVLIVWIGLTLHGARPPKHPDRMHGAPAIRGPFRGGFFEGPPVGPIHQGESSGESEPEERRTEPTTSPPP